MNQIITYRAKNPYNSSWLGSGDGAYLAEGFFNNDISDNNGITGGNAERLDDGLLKKESDNAQWDSFVRVFPQCPSEYGMCLTSDAVNAKLSLAPGESVSFQLHIEYHLKNDKPESSQKEFTIGFNVRNSLYLEPLYYQLRFIGKYNQTTGDRLASAKTNVETLTKYNVTVR